MRERKNLLGLVALLAAGIAVGIFVASYSIGETERKAETAFVAKQAEEVHLSGKAFFKEVVELIPGASVDMSEVGIKELLGTAESCTVAGRAGGQWRIDGLLLTPEGLATEKVSEILEENYPSFVTEAVNPELLSLDAKTGELIQLAKTGESWRIQVRSNCHSA